MISEEEDSTSSQLTGEEDSEAADAMTDTDLAEGDLDDSGSSAGVIVLVVVIVALVVGGVIFCYRRRRENKN